MKYLIPFCLLLPLSSLSAPKKMAQFAQSYHFVEMKSYREDPSLPPTLQITFEIDCGDEFVQVIRQDIPTGGASAPLHIAIGGIAKSNSQSACVGTLREKTVEAGTTFSGRPYEIVKILKDSKRAKVMRSASVK